MRERYKYEVIGHNYRLTDIHAAIAVPQVARMFEISEIRKSNAAVLNEGFAGLNALRTPAELPGRSHVWHQYTIVLTDSSPITRDEFVAKLSEAGIASGAYYPKLAFDYDCFRNDKRVIVNEVPVATKVAANCVSLPVHQHLSKEDLGTIIYVVTDLLD
jgi:dTDP-4-amino-4,6-dideoxygalactose transaminase